MDSQTETDSISVLQQLSVFFLQLKLKPQLLCKAKLP